MKLTARNVHRDLAYFYLGLIISFSLSGIFLNHRQVWHPRRYVSEMQAVKLANVPQPDSINEEFVKRFGAEQKIPDPMRRFRVEKGELLISYTNTDVKINLQTGEGSKEIYKTTPILGQMTKLHQDTSQWWIYYSDIFGLAMLVIAITGMFISKGATSFRERGWKLALVGILFPLIFLFVIA